MAYRIEELQLKNFGMVEEFYCNQFSNINLIIGENGTGKTFLLKAMYSPIKSQEEYKPADDITSINDILSEKLRWTFQVDKLGDIVSRTAKAKDGLDFCMKLDKISLNYQFSKSAASKVSTVEPVRNGKEGNSIFIPAKEVLSLFSVILKSREIDKSFGFDDTYYDVTAYINSYPSDSVQRKILSMYFYQDKSDAQIAQKLKLSRQYVNRMKKKLILRYISENK